jgi:hypothetical protein
MKEMRFAAKALAGTFATTALLLGALAGPAEAKKDTGWGKPLDSVISATPLARDTGWG